MKVAWVDDEVGILEIMSELCTLNGLEPHVFSSGQSFLDAFAKETFEMVFCDINMPEISGIEVFNRALQQQKTLPYWVFVSGFVTNELVKNAMQQHTVDLLVKPFSKEQYKTVLERAKRLKSNPFEAVYLSVEILTGVKFNSDYRTGIESRVKRRLKSLGFTVNDEYLGYFHKNKASELDFITGLLTTHTTSFFREMDHFLFLNEKVLPSLLVRKPVSLLIEHERSISTDECVFWSAACSTGQEPYSIAMCCYAFLEEARTKGLEGSLKAVKILGTDVDSNSVSLAREGIYTLEEMHGIDDGKREAFFQKGRQELEGLYKVKDSIWKKCSFRPFNLLSKNLPLQDVDVIFLRNVMIYFSADDISHVIKHLTGVLRPGGYLFVGHTESGLVKHSDLVSRAPGVFQKVDNSRADAESAMGALKRLSTGAEKGFNRLLAFGSSTGGTQALRKALEHLRDSSFPPVLITQHFPEEYTQTFAKMLASSLGVKVVVATDRQRIVGDVVYLCPGNHHMVIDKAQRLRIEKAQPNDVVSPEIDRLFLSIAENAAQLEVLAVILTGMGKDGSVGLKAIREKVKKSVTIAESEETAVVYGMPKNAFETGAAIHSFALPKIATFVKDWISGAKASGVLRGS